MTHYKSCSEWAEIVSPFDAFDAEALLHIISYVPLRPRLRVLAVLSSRWNLLVRETITRAKQPYLPPRATRIFPNLTRLDSLHLKLEVIPRSVSYISLTAPPPMYLSFVPCLTSLSLDRISRAELRLLRDVSTQLHQLTIRTGGPAEAEHVAAFAALRFPALRSLKLWLGDPAKPLYSAFAKLYSQLTFISFQGRDLPFDELTRYAALPNLRRLQVPAEAMFALLPLCSSLRSVTVDVSGRYFTAALTALAHIELKLRGCTINDSAELDALLTTLPRLTQLISLEVVTALVPLGGLLLPSLTSLTSLSLRLEKETDSTVLQLSLPLLRVLRLDLTCHYGNNGVSGDLVVTMELMSRNHSLRHLELALLWTPELFHIAMQLFARAQEIGLECVQIIAIDAPADLDVAAAKIEQSFLWLRAKLRRG